MSKPKHRPKPDRSMLDIQTDDIMQDTLRDFDEWLHTPNPQYDIDVSGIQELVNALDNYDALTMEL